MSKIGISALRYSQFAILSEKASTEEREETVGVIKIAFYKRKKKKAQKTNQQALSLRYFSAYKN